MTLNTIERIRKAVEMRPEQIYEEKLNGKFVIGWFGYTIPEEIIHALGMIPVRLGRYGDEQLVEIGARYISSQNCAYIRACMGLFAEGREPYIQASDAIAFDNSCMQIYRLGEVSKYYFGKKSIFLGVPRNPHTPVAQKYFSKGLENFTRDLEEISGKKMDKISLASSIELYNDIRQAIQELYRFSFSNSSPLNWSEINEIVHAGYYLDRRYFLSLLKELFNEVETSPSIPYKSDGKVRILLSGSVITPGDSKLSDIIKNTKARIVGDDLWSGLNPYLKIDIRDSSIAQIAEAYMNRIPHYTLPCLNPESDERYIHLKEIIDETSAHGIIYHTIRYCDSATFKSYGLKERLKKEGIPMLEIHTEYSGSDFEAIRTRIEAFVELLQYKMGTGVQI